jgi:hypothetical protein
MLDVQLTSGPVGLVMRERREYVLPVRFDDTPLPGLLPDMVTVDLRTRTPQQFAAMIASKLADPGHYWSNHFVHVHESGVWVADSDVTDSCSPGPAGRVPPGARRHRSALPVAPLDSLLAPVPRRASRASRGVSSPAGPRRADGASPAMPGRRRSPRFLPTWEQLPSAA